MKSSRFSFVAIPATSASFLMVLGMSVNLCAEVKANKTLNVAWQLPIDREKIEFIHDLQFSPCGKYLVYIERQRQSDGTMAKLVMLEINSRKRTTGPRELLLGCDRCLRFSPDGRLVAFMEDGRRLVVYKFPEMELVFADRYNDNAFPCCLNFSMDGKRLIVALEAQGKKPHDDDAVGNAQTYVCVYDTKSGKCQSEFYVKNAGYAKGVVALENSDEFILGKAGFISVLSVTGESRRSTGYFLFYSELSDLAVSPQGNSLAAVYLTGRICLWDPRRIALPKHHPYVMRYAAAEYFRVCFSADGHWLFVAGCEFDPPEQEERTTGIVHVWNLADKRLHAKYRVAEEEVRELALSPDNTLLAVYDPTARRIKVYKLPEEYWQKK